MGRDIVIVIGIVVPVSSSWGWACIPFAARRDIGKVAAFAAGAVLWPGGLALIALTHRVAARLALRSEQHDGRVVPSADGLVGAAHHG